MSRASNLPNDKESIKKYVQKIGAYPYVERVLLAGSRSPLREKKHRYDSDRDLVAVSNIPNLKIPHPRHTKQLHADLIVVERGKEKHIRKFVEIYPKDEYNLLS